MSVEGKRLSNELRAVEDNGEDRPVTLRLRQIETAEGPVVGVFVAVRGAAAQTVREDGEHRPVSLQLQSRQEGVQGVGVILTVNEAVSDSIQGTTQGGKGRTSRRSELLRVADGERALDTHEAAAAEESADADEVSAGGYLRRE